MFGFKLVDKLCVTWQLLFFVMDMADNIFQFLTAALIQGQSFGSV